MPTQHPTPVTPTIIASPTLHRSPVRVLAAFQRNVLIQYPVNEGISPCCFGASVLYTTRKWTGSYKAHTYRTIATIMPKTIQGGRKSTCGKELLPVVKTHHGNSRQKKPVGCSEASIAGSGLPTGHALTRNLTKKIRIVHSTDTRGTTHTISLLHLSVMQTTQSHIWTRFTSEVRTSPGVVRNRLHLDTWARPGSAPC